MRDEDTRWLGFKDTIKFLQSRHGPTEQMLSIYHRRDSYIERFLSGLILVPSRRLSDELTRPAFSFVPHDSTRRLVKYSKYHFLGSALCKLAGLTSVNESCYVDENGKPAAQQKRTFSYEEEIETTLRRDILQDYCQHHRLVPVWVVNATRLSERSVREIKLAPERVDVAGSSFCYFHLFRKTPKHFRARMSSLSLIYGKRLLFP